MDYIQTTPVTLEFENCIMIQCHCIPIVDDDVLEGNEMFYVTLERGSDRDNIKLHRVNGSIHIIDNDGRDCTYEIQVIYIFVSLQKLQLV